MEGFILSLIQFACPMPDLIATETFSLIAKDFALPETKEVFSEEKALQLLTQTIRTLLDRDFERLLQVCYRIDLGEEKLKKILHESEPDQVAPDLALALWERQKMKVALRKKYSEDSP